MTTDDVLVLAWLLLAHLVADFLLQTDRVVADKFGSGLRAWRGLALHGAAVALCLAPVVLAYGLRGLALLAIVTLGHVLIDRWKTVATRRADARADAAARAAGPWAGQGVVSSAAGQTGTDPDVPEALGPAWTPVPAFLFVLDQVFHVALIGVAWLLLLAREAPTGAWVAAVDAMLGGFPREDVHRGATFAAVLGSLLIVNVRAGSFFVGTLVRPRNGADAPVVTLEPPVAPPPDPPLPPVWRVRLGPLVAVAEPSRASTAAPGPRGGSGGLATAVAHASPVRIGAAIGILERLLIVIFVLSGAVAAIGFVVAAKTLARFKQLDDRDFAEYYLLGTLASVTVGLASALLAQAALATMPA